MVAGLWAASLEVVQTADLSAAGHGRHPQAQKPPSHPLREAPSLAVDLCFNCFAVYSTWYIAYTSCNVSSCDNVVTVFYTFMCTDMI